MQRMRGTIVIELLVVFVIGGVLAVCTYIAPPQLPPPTAIEQVIHK